MRPCIIGIGGAGASILREFMQSQDILILGWCLGEYMAYGGIKGIWIDSQEADIDNAKINPGRFYKGPVENYYPGYIVPHAKVETTSRVKTYITEKYGFDLKEAGFDRKAEPLKAIFDIFETDQKAIELSGEGRNPLLWYTYKGISKFMTRTEKSPDGKLPTTEKPTGIGGLLGHVSPSVLQPNGTIADESCDSFFFIASLGGGTGTGFMNPITSYHRKNMGGTTPILALCVFTEKKEDDKKTSEEQKDLAAIIAMYDLLTKKKPQGIDGLILIDNQILRAKHGDDYSSWNKEIFSAMRPLIDQHDFPGSSTEAKGLQRVFNLNLDFPGVLVPCFASGDSSQFAKKAAESSNSFERYLVDKALTDGKLFPCDFRKADAAYVFTRGGFLHENELENVLKEKIGEDIMIKVYRKLGEDNSAEVLILLRNPYGREEFNFSKDKCGKPCSNKETWEETQSDSFEQRIYCAICMGLERLKWDKKEIIPAGLPEVTKFAYGTYFFGKDWIDRTLLPSLKENPHLEERDQKFMERLEKYSKKNLPFLQEELEKSLGRLQQGNFTREHPVFEQELKIFDKDKLKIFDEDQTTNEDTGPETPEITPMPTEYPQILRPFIENEIKRILDERGYPEKGI